MAKTYTWTGSPGTAASGSVPADWSPSGGPPQTGDTAILSDGGTILLGDTPFVANTLLFGNGLLDLVGDGQANLARPSVDQASLITTNTGTNVAQSSTIDATGNFVNEGTILANGANGSTLTVNVGTAVINGTTVAGYAYNTGVIQADPGNSITIAAGASSELFNSGSIIANGGSVLITAATSAIAGGYPPIKGYALIEGGGTLETAIGLSTSVGGTTPYYAFRDNTPGNTLKIDNIGSFGGQIIGLSAGDTIDLGTSLAVAQLAFDTASEILTLENAGGTALASLIIRTGAFGNGTFTLTNGAADGFTIGTSTDGTNDTTLSTSLVTPSASGVSGQWQSSGSWNNGIVPGVTDTPLIGQGLNSNFTLTTGGTPVTVTGFTVTEPNATLQITSDTTVTGNTAGVGPGTLDVMAGVTLVSPALSQSEMTAATTIAAGATVALSGHENSPFVPTAGVLTGEGTDTPFAVNIYGGTLQVDGALLAGAIAGGSNGGETVIGYDGEGSTQVTVNGDGAPGDGKVTDDYTVMGSDPTSSGTLTLNGPGASWTDTIDPADTVGARGYMLVGYNNLSSNTPAGLTPPPPAQAAQLLIENGATLTEQTYAEIANNANSAGSVTVETGGFWNIAVNGVGFMSVGLAGAGSLSILNGGSVEIGNVGTILNNGTTLITGGIGVGHSAAATGSVIVSGTNPAGGTSSQLTLLDGISVGQDGQGLLAINDGGIVQVQGSGISVGTTAGANSSGTIQVGGTGSPAALNFAAGASGMTVGSNSKGTLSVFDNGTVNLNGTAGVGFGGNANGLGIGVIGGSIAPAVMNITVGGISVGQSGTGSLTVNTLGTIAMTGTGGIGIGTTSGATGSLIIDGGLLTQNSTANGIGVGNASGTNTSMLVENAGTVSLGGNWLTLGSPNGSSGTVTVTGSGSDVKTTGTAGITIGNSGTGVLDVTAGGTVDLESNARIVVANNFNSNGQLNVTGGNVVLGAGSSGMFVGGSGAGLLNVTSGDVSDGSFLIAGANQNNHGTVTISGGIVSAASVDIGQFGTGTATITGGTLFTGGVFGIGVGNSGSGTVTVSGPGADLAAKAIEVGEIGSGTLNVVGETLTTTGLSLGGSAATPLGNAANKATLTSGADLQVTGALAVWFGSTLSVDGSSGIDVGSSGVYDAGQINLENGNSIVGNGVIAVPVVNDGVIDASGAGVPGPTNFSGLTLQGALTGSGSLNIEAGGIMRIGAALPAVQSIQFSTGSELILNTPGSALTNQITNLSDNDRIELNVGGSITGVSSAGINVLNVTISNGSTYQLSDLNFAAGSGTSFSFGKDFNTGYQYVQVQTPTENWNGNAGDGLYSDPGNWQSNTVPNGTDQVGFFSNPGTVIGSGSALAVFVGPFNQVNSNNWTFNGLNLTILGQANPPFLPTTLGFWANTVLNGATLNAAGGGDSIYNVDGVTVTAKAASNVTVMDDNVGTNTGMSGSLVLTGANTTWTEVAGQAINGNTPGYISVGGNGPSNGQSGSNGFLTVTGGAVLNTGGGANLGGQSGSFGSATVSAAGSAVAPAIGSWTVGGNLIDGNSGIGTLTVTGGIVSAGGQLDLGVNVGGFGAALLNGASLTVGGTLTNGTITAAGMQIGQNGGGLMTVSTGGLLKFGGTFNPVGANPGSTGTLLIVNGGTAFATQPAGSTSILQIGNSGTSSSLGASNGAVVVSGSGSLLNLNGNAMTVGSNGVGTLSVTNGATVDASVLNSNSSAAVYAGGNAGSDAQIFVNGAAASGRATLNVGGYVALAQGGSSSMTVGSGGLVAITNAATNGGGLGVGIGNPSFANEIGGQGEADVTGGGTVTVQNVISVGGNGASGVLNIKGGGFVSTASGLMVGGATTNNGTVYGGTGSVNIGAGSTFAVTGTNLNDFTVEIGDGNNSSTTGLAQGYVTVSGAGADLTTNDNPLQIAPYADGILTVSQGGSVTAGTQNSVSLAAIGIGRQGVGSLELTDPGSTIAAIGLVYVGREGTGNLLVENHARLSTSLDPIGAGEVAIGAATGGNGTTQTSVQTGGTGNALVSGGGDIYSQENVIVGESDTTGSLSVNTGGTVEANDQVIIGESETISTGGTVITDSGNIPVTGSGLLLTGLGTVTVGAGSLLRADGANIRSKGTAAVVIGAGTGASATLNVTGSGATVNGEGFGVSVGAVGDGSLLIGQGGQVLAATKYAADDAVTAGAAAGATGAITVTDPGSALIATGQLGLGVGGQGSLLVENQGAVTTGNNSADTNEGVDIGQTAGGSGTATVTGANSSLSNTGTFVVGDAGLGSLAVDAGGTVTTSANATIANTASAAGSSANVTGGNFLVAGTLVDGNAGAGLLDIGPGGAVSALELDLGSAAGGAGVLTIDGPGSSLNATNSLVVGAAGVGELSILDGASVTIGGDLDIGVGAGASGNVDIENTTGTTTINGGITLGAGGGVAVLTIGTLTDVVLNGGLFIGKHANLVKHTNFDPPPYLSNAGGDDEGSGVDSYKAYVQNTGAITQDQGGTLVLQTPTVYGAGGGFQINTGGSELDLNADGVSGQVFDFTDNTGTLVIGIDQLTTIDTPSSGTGPFTAEKNPNLGQLLIGGFGGTIAGMVAGDAVVVDTTAAAHISYAGGGSVVSVIDNAAGTQVGTLAFASAALAAQIGIGSVSAKQLELVTCFAAGTRIGTDRGPVAVESLQVGDAVVLAGVGARAAVRIGSRTIDCARHPRPKTVWPVCVARGAFGGNVPERDLYLSPDHAVFVDSVLVPVKLLVNGTSITQVERDRITYYHVELPEHAVILAEGLPVESYLDTGDRYDFTTDAGVIRLHPDFAARLAANMARLWETRAAAPLVLAGPTLAAARKIVASNAKRGVGRRNGRRLRKDLK